jgi:hypothetical protein
MFYMCAEKILGAKIKFFCSSLLTAAILLLVFAALLYARQSLSWQILCDLPCMLYNGLLINDFGLMPYRDFFETNPPGTMVLYAALQHIIQGNSLYAHILDLAILLSISCFTCLALWSHGLRSGLLASASFVFAYLNCGGEHSLQREYLCVFALALSLAIAFNAKTLRKPSYMCFIALGALAGVVFSIKPPLALCWLPIVAFAALQKINTRHSNKSLFGVIGRMVLCTLAGAVLVPLALLIWLYESNALGPFWRMAANYWPLYAQLSGQAGILAQDPLAVLNRYWFNTVLSSAAWWSSARLFSDFDKLSFMGFISGVVLLKDKNFSRQIMALWALIFLSYLYIPISGKFWRYHYIPLFYALSVSAGLLVSKQFLKKINFSPCASIVITVALLCCFPLQAATDWNNWRFPESARVVKIDDIDFIESYLNEHAEPDDLIMPMETAAGAIHALYRMHRPLVGKFLYDFPFYHHAEHPYIQELRTQMMTDLMRLKPKFIVRATKSWRSPAVKPSWNFTELDAFISENYSPATDGSRSLQVLTLKQK